MGAHLKATSGGSIDLQQYNEQHLKDQKARLDNLISGIKNVHNRHIIETLKVEREQYISVGRLQDIVLISKMLSNDLNIEFGKLTAGDIQKWLLSKHLMPRSFNVYIRLLSRVIAEKVLDQIEKRRVTERSVKDKDILTIDERLAIIKSCNSKRDMCMVTILLNVGCRRNELLKIAKQDIKYDQPPEGQPLEKGDMYVMVQNSKLSQNKEPVYEGEIEFGQIYVEDYLAMPEVQALPNEALLFPMTGINCHQLIKRAAERAKITKPFSPHKWRHARQTELEADERYKGFDLDRRFGRTPGSGSTAIYSHGTSHKARLKAKAAMKGMPTPAPLKPKQCPRCMTILAPSDTTCTRCYKVIDIEAEKAKFQARVRERELTEKVESLQKQLDQTKSAMDMDKLNAVYEFVMKQQEEQAKLEEAMKKQRVEEAIF